MQRKYCLKVSCLYFGSFRHAKFWDLKFWKHDKKIDKIFEGLKQKNVWRGIVVYPSLALETGSQFGSSKFLIWSRQREYFPKGSFSNFDSFRHVIRYSFWKHKIKIGKSFLWWKYKNAKERKHCHIPLKHSKHTLNLDLVDYCFVGWKKKKKKWKEI